MKKLLNYLKQGKGRGLIAMLLLSLLMGIITYSLYNIKVESPINQVLNHPEVQSFLQEFPALPIKDGQIQGDIVWARLIPGANVPIVINTSVDNISENLPGIYITRSKIISTLNNTTWDIFDNQEVTFVLKDFLGWMLRVVLPVVAFMLPFVMCWILFLLTVAVVKLIALAAHIPHKNGRVWRTSLLTCAILILSLLNPLTYLTPLLIAILFSVLLLGVIDTKEI